MTLQGIGYSFFVILQKYKTSIEKHSTMHKSPTYIVCSQINIKKFILLLECSIEFSEETCYQVICLNKTCTFGQGLVKFIFLAAEETE